MFQRNCQLCSWVEFILHIKHGVHSIYNCNDVIIFCYLKIKCFCCLLGLTSSVCEQILRMQSHWLVSLYDAAFALLGTSSFLVEVNQVSRSGGKERPLGEKTLKKKKKKKKMHNRGGNPVAPPAANFFVGEKDESQKRGRGE